MSKPFNSALPLDYSPKKKPKEAEAKLDLKPCLNYGKSISDGYYGQWAGGGACSKACNTAQEQKPRYPEHTEEAFLKRLQEQQDASDEVLRRGDDV